jgi:hypothetical protein
MASPASPSTRIDCQTSGKAVIPECATGGSASKAGYNRLLRKEKQFAAPAANQQREIPHWLQPPPDPQPSDRIVQIRAMATRPPASLLLLLFAAKYQLSFASSQSTLRPLSSSTKAKAYHAIMAIFVVAGHASKARFALRAFYAIIGLIA